MGRLEALIHSAQGILVGKLQGDLIVLPGGVLEPTDANLRSIRGISKYFEEAMARAGYQQLVADFASTFAGNFVYFDDILAQMAADGLIPASAVHTILGKGAQAELSSQIIASENALLAVVKEISAEFEQTAALSIGAGKFSDLVTRISIAMQTSIPKANTIAVTAQTNFFRAISDRGFAAIEDGLGMVGKYAHVGPDDIVTRPMCHAWLNGSYYHSVDKKGREVLVMASPDATYTIEEIRKMKNGFGSDPMLNGGGPNCRHVEVLRRMEKVQAVAA